MARFTGVLSFLATVTIVGAAWAGNPHNVVAHAAPELGTTGAAAGIALIAGAVAIAIGRRRGRKTP
jgi:hypothetical protein